MGWGGEMGEGVRTRDLILFSYLGFGLKIWAGEGASRFATEAPYEFLMKCSRP